MIISYTGKLEMRGKGGDKKKKRIMVLIVQDYKRSCKR